MPHAVLRRRANRETVEQIRRDPFTLLGDDLPRRGVATAALVRQAGGMPMSARAPRIGRGLLNESWIRARRAEPYLTVAVETLGDLDPGVASLYVQVVVAQLLDPQAGAYVDGFPVETARARALPTIPDTCDHSGCAGGTFDTRLDALRAVVEGWGPDEAWPHVGGDVTERVPLDVALALARWNLPPTAAVRRRLLMRDVVEPRVYAWIRSQVRPADRQRATAEMRQAVGTLSPETGLPLLLRPLVGKREAFTPEQVASAVEVSTSAVKKWLAGDIVPGQKRWAALDAVLHLKRGATHDAVNDRVPDGWPLSHVEDVPGLAGDY